MQTITHHTSETVNAQICQLRSKSGLSQSDLSKSGLSKSGLSLVRGFAGLSVVAGLMAIVLPVPSAIAANGYERCTTDLLGSKISTEEATSACARAFFPEDLSACVSKLSAHSFAAADALTACRQVRRPIDLASCTIDIRLQITDSTPATVLDSCRRSLLPRRYADCVVGLNKAAKVPAAKALDSCIDANYFPREVDPTFLPFTPSGGVSIAPLQTETTTPSNTIAPATK